MNPTVWTAKADRLPGAVLVGAAGIMMSGAAIGFYAPSLREAPWSDDPQQLAAAVAGNPTAFAWANGLILAATVITALALVPVSIRFEGRGRPWALTALAAFFFAAVFEAIDRMISVHIYAWAAQQGLDVTDVTIQAFDRLDDGLGAGFYILAFLALGLYGIAMSKGTVARGVGWLFVAGGVLGIVLALVGAAIPVMVFVGTAALGVASWLFGVAPEPGN